MEGRLEFFEIETFISVLLLMIKHDTIVHFDSIVVSLNDDLRSYLNSHLAITSGSLEPESQNDVIENEQKTNN